MKQQSPAVIDLTYSLISAVSTAKHSGRIVFACSSCRHSKLPYIKNNWYPLYFKSPDFLLSGFRKTYITAGVHSQNQQRLFARLGQPGPTPGQRSNNQSSSAHRSQICFLSNIFFVLLNKNFSLLVLFPFQTCNSSFWVHYMPVHPEHQTLTSLHKGHTAFCTGPELWHWM